MNLQKEPFLENSFLFFEEQEEEFEEEEEQEQQEFYQFGEREEELGMTWRDFYF